MLTRLRTEVHRRRALLGDEAGLTLAELIVTMSLMSIVGAMSLYFVVGMNQQSDRTRVASQSISDARTAMSTVLQSLRFADSPTAQPGAAAGRFESIAADKIVFYSNGINRTGSGTRTAPTKVTLTVANGALVQELYSPKAALPTDWTTNYDATPTLKRTLLSAARTGTGFAFCSSQADASGNCVPTTSPTAVAAVVVTLVTPGGNGQANQTYAATASITGALQ